MGFAKNALLLCCLVLPVKAFLQNPYNVMDWSTHGSLYNYLLEKAHSQYDQRRRDLNKSVAGRQPALSYISAARTRVLQLLGDTPKECPLNAKITGTVKCKGYRVEKLVYESFAGHHVTANLYLPERKGIFPAMLFLCGHEDAAKTTESYQQTASLFVRNGFVVLVIDPISQGERLQLTSAKENALERVGKKEHTLLNGSSNLAGSSTAAYQAWDNKCGIDYLETRPEVDAGRIGCVGNSGGGMQAIYFSAFDKRVKVTAVCSYLSSRERMYDIHGPTDGCVELPNEGRMRMEMSDYLIAAAPKPLLILAGRFDSIDFIGTLAAYNDLKRIYEAIGKPAQLRMFTYDDGHGISRPKREAAVSWFRKWLCNDSIVTDKEELPVLSAGELNVTRSGQLNTDYPNEVNIAMRNLSLFDSLKDQRQKFLRLNKTKQIDSIRNLLNITPQQHKISIERKSNLVKDKIVYEKLIIRKQGEVPLPALVLLPSARPVKITIWLNDKGKDQIADSTRLIQDYLDKGSAVIICDVRGTGETEDPAKLNEARYSNKEYRNAMLGMHIGESLVAQRAKDILTILDFADADERIKKLPVEVYAAGVIALPALHAALFSNRISHLTLYNSIRSFREILERPLAQDWYSYIIPGIIKYYDIPDLTGIAGVNRISFINE